MPCGTKGLTVAFYVAGQFWEWIDRRRDQDGIPPFTSKSCGFRTIGSNTQWRIRFLQRLRSYCGRRNAKMFSLEGTGGLCPCLFDNRQCFFKPFATLIARHLKSLKMDSDGPSSNAKLQASL